MTGAVLALVLLGGEVTRAEVLTPSAAIGTTNWPGRLPTEMINGSGLTAVGNVSTWTHAPNGGATAMWHAGTEVGGLGGVVGNPPVTADQALVFTMPGKVNLTGAYIWQMAQNLTRGVKDFDILYTTDADPLTGTYTSLGTYTLDQPLISAAEPVQVKNFVASDVRHVKFDINSAQSGAVTEYVGLSEVRFEGTIIQPLVPRLEINRQTGEIVIRNNSINTADLNFIAYSVLSNTNGSLNPTTWDSIADRDANSSMTVDPNDVWVEFTAPAAANNLSEGELPGGNGVSLLNSDQSISLGNSWLRTPYQDVSVQLLQANGTNATVSVNYTGSEIPVGDLNGSGSITPADWTAFRTGMGGSYPTLSRAQAYLQGDLDGDLDSDLSDFLIFKAAYDVDNGTGAFAAMAAAVPEPSTFILVMGCLGLLCSRRLRVSNHCLQAAAVAVALVAVVASSKQSHAVVLDLTTAPAFSSSNFDLTAAFLPTNAFDGNITTRWASGAPLSTAGASQWIYVDLGQDYQLNSTTLNWESSSANTYTVLARTAAQGDPGGALANPADSSWRTISSATGLGGVAAGGAPGIDQVFNHNLGTATNSANVGGTLTVNEFGPIARYLMVHGILESSSGGSLYSMWDVTVDAAAPITPLVLSVDQGIGEITIKNTGAGATSLLIDGYQINSASMSLKTSGWDGLGAVPTFPLGDGTGNGWEKGLGAGPARLEEGFLTGSSSLAVSGEYSLGEGYNTTVGAEDLVFQYSIAGLGIRTGMVVYEAADPVNGDYNGNGIVDAADYTVWRDNLGQPAGSLPNRNPVHTGAISQDDYTYWKSRFGATSNGAGAGSVSAVPEPTSVVLLLIAAAALCCRRGVRGC